MAHLSEERKEEEESDDACVSIIFNYVALVLKLNVFSGLCDMN